MQGVEGASRAEDEDETGEGHLTVQVNNRGCVYQGVGNSAWGDLHDQIR